MDAPRQHNRPAEHAANGVDNFLQGVGGDPYGGVSWTGLRVPTAATPPIGSGGLNSRYLFLLSYFEVEESHCVRVRGARQGWTLGAEVGGSSGIPPREVEMFVTTPTFRLPDANISWHMRVLSRDEVELAGPVGPFDTNNLAFRMTKGEALLYESIDFPVSHLSPLTGKPDYYTFLSSYTPPNLGRPYGSPLTPDLGSFYDLRFQQRDSDVWDALDIPLIVGPAAVCFFASVRQSNPATRIALPTPGPFTSGSTGGPGGYIPTGLPPEEAFLLNFPSAVIWRVMGSLIAEVV